MSFLCQQKAFSHDEENDDHLDDINTIEEEIYPNENQFDLCKLKLASRNDLMDHIEQNHVEYVKCVMEIAVLFGCLGLFGPLCALNFQSSMA